MSAKIEKICGIYKITSPSGRIYIGQTQHIYKRWKMYETCIFRTKHRGQPHLYNSLLKYGVSSHKFEIVELCKPEELDEKEMFYIKEFRTFKTPHGMNCSAGGGGRRGYTLSEESKRKIGAGSKGRIYSEATINKLKEAAQKSWATRRANGEIKHTEATIVKMRETSRRKYANGYVSPSKGKKQSEELVKRKSEWFKGEKNPMYGKPRTEEQKNAQRLKMLGHKHSSHTEESKAKLRAARLGKKASEETKEKMRQSHIGIHAGQKHPRYGKRLSPEERQKYGVAIKNGWAARKQTAEYNSEESKLKRSEAKFKAWETKRLKLGAAI